MNQQTPATRVWRTSTPSAIESDLTALWSDTARGAPIARAVMSNLVVFLDRPARDDVDLSAPIEGVPIEEVARRHPSRVLVLQHAREAPDAKAPIDAGIGIYIFGPDQARFGVEEIVIRSACADVSLPSIVRALTRGDVPTSIWWAGDLSRAKPLLPLLSMGRQLVYDSRQWQNMRAGVLTVASLPRRAEALDLADLNWRRLTQMRQALMQSLAPALQSGSIRMGRAQIGHRPGEEALAWLLCGWMSSRLGWKEANLPVTIEEGRRGDEMLWIDCGSGDEPELTATMDEHRVLVKYAHGAAPFSIARRHETYADALAAELEALGRDKCLHETLDALERLFGAPA